jgi:hypothetical protein
MRHVPLRHHLWQVRSLLPQQPSSTLLLMSRSFSAVVVTPLTSRVGGAPLMSSSSRYLTASTGGRGGVGGHFSNSDVDSRLLQHPFWDDDGELHHGIYAAHWGGGIGEGEAGGESLSSATHIREEDRPLLDEEELRLRKTTASTKQPSPK